MIFAGGGLANVDGGRHRMPKGVDAMLNRFTQLRRKEVINLCDGCRLGCVGDVEVKLPEGEVLMKTVLYMVSVLDWFYWGFLWI